MSWIPLGALAIGPALILLHRAWVRDLRREPARNVLVYVAWGALATFPAALVEGLLEPAFLAWSAPPSATRFAMLLAWSLLGIALVEELAKWLPVRLRGTRDPHLDEPFDWIVYCVGSALGFATVENLFYVFQEGAATGVARAFTAVPAHAFCGTLMGSRLAQAALSSGRDARRSRALALVEPALWHGLYDFLLLARRHEIVAGSSLATLFEWAWLGLFLALWRTCAVRTRKLAEIEHVPAPPILWLGTLAQELRRTRGA